MTDVEDFIRFCEREFGATIMDREAAYVKQYVDEDDRILDVGCGIGSLEERLEEYEVIGLDQSGAMVRTASERVPGRFLLGDARFLPIGTAAVDAIVFVATLEFIQDIDTVLSEAARVLTSDGTFLALMLNTQSEYVKANLTREGSYFQQMVHRDSEELTATVLGAIDGSQEYFLGIEDVTVFESREPSTAAMTAVVGSPGN
jgi:ubiquinone/menaquinone biosynthesis C-methylase UbiE